jgi:hypothetical protein
MFFKNRPVKNVPEFGTLTKVWSLTSILYNSSRLNGLIMDSRNLHYAPEKDHGGLIKEIREQHEVPGRKRFFLATGCFLFDNGPLSIG